MIAMLFFKQSSGTTVLTVAPVVWRGTFLFVGLMVVGLGCMDAGLCYVAAKMKKPGTIVLFVVSFFCSLCMGYLSSQDFAQASMNWIAEGVNVVGQGCFLAGAVVLDKAGIETYTLPRKK